MWEEEQLTLHLTNGVLQTMIKEEIYNLMQNEVEKMKIGVGAMSELLRMFYDSLIQNNFTPDQAILLTFSPHVRG